jgi:hypothetical protein
MKLSKLKRILLGILSIWPITYIVFMLVFVYGIFLHHYTPIHELSPVNLLTGLLNLGLEIFYIVHAIKSIDPKSNMRVIWIIVLLMFGFIAFPIYWYLYIWKEQGRGLITQGPQEQRKP